jgi:hypothetical protein
MRHSQERQWSPALQLWLNWASRKAFQYLRASSGQAISFFQVLRSQAPRFRILRSQVLRLQCLACQAPRFRAMPSLA